MMKKVVFLLLTVCLALFAEAESGSSAALLQAARQATPQRMPDADSALIEDLTLVEYNADGSYHYVSDVSFRILTEKGRQEHSTVSIGYDAAYGSQQFTLAEIIRPDGTVVPIDLKPNTRETINAGQMSANIYDPNHKNIRLNIPDLQIGDILHYSYRGERTKAVVPGTWSDLFLLEEPYPVLHSLYEVTAPASLPLTRIELKDEIPDTVTFRKEELDGKIRYTWEARNVPQMFEEPEMPARHTVAQRVLLSTIPDWETLSRWYWELSLPHLDDTTPAMEEKVHELIDGITDRQKQIEAIFRFVSQDIRYMGITIEDEAPGYEPHDVSLTFDNRYGVCRDKAALLVSMLRLAGFDAYPVLIYVGPKKDPEVPQPWFNHAITAVRNEDGTYQLMDSTDENTRDLLPAYLCNRSYLVAHPDGEPLMTSPIIPPEQNMLTIDISAELDDSNQITGIAKLAFDGINDTAYRGRLARLKAEERRPYFEERLKRALGSASLTSLDISPKDVRDTTQPLSVKLGFEIQNAAAAGPEESLLKVPTLINHFGLFGALLGNGTGLDKRTYPLQTEITCGVTETVRLDLSSGSLRPADLPSYETVDTPQLYISRSMTETSGVITATADLKLRTVEFSPEEYLQLKQDLKTAEKNARKRVVLASGGFPAEADFATLDEHIYYAVYSPARWAKVHTVKQKVLTYSGKRALSDIKIAYNPAMEEASINYARVTAPDGTVRELHPETEVNVMDAPWAGEAPRYPAEKIMVASLPGVDVDSVIEYQLVTLYTNQPFFSAVETFSGHNPIVKKTVQVEFPHTIEIDIGNTAPGVIRRRTSHNNGNVVHEWFVANRPMIGKESHQPPSWVLAPSLLLSTGNMKKYADTVESQLLRAADVTPNLKELALDLTKGLKERTEKMRRLNTYVDQTIRSAGPALPRLPLSAITPAEKTLSDGYGNRTDRAVLLHALCKAAKLKPRFVLGSDLPELPDVSDPVLATFQRSPFERLYVAVEDKKTTYYLGDGGRYSRLNTLAHESRPAVNLKNGEIEHPSSSVSNQIETTFAMQIDWSGDAELVKRSVYSGTEFEKFHKQFAEFTPEEFRREQQAQLSRLSQSAQAAGPMIPSFKEGSLLLAATLKNYASTNGGYLYFTLPETLNNIFGIREDERKTPFYISNELHRMIAYEITLPKGYRPALIPESFRVELPENGGTVEVAAGMVNGKLMIFQKVDLNPTLIPVDQFEEILKINDQLTRPAARTILLRKQ